MLILGRIMTTNSKVPSTLTCCLTFSQTSLHLEFIGTFCNQGHCQASRTNFYQQVRRGSPTNISSTRRSQSKL